MRLTFTRTKAQLLARTWGDNQRKALAEDWLALHAENERLRAALDQATAGLLAAADYFGAVNDPERACLYRVEHDKARAALRPEE